MDDSCAVCAENLEWVAYGSCGHREVCSTCVVRLRFVLDDRRCCICKTESPTVFVTKAMGDYTRVITDFSAFSGDATEGKVGAYWYHEDTQAYFDDVDHYKMIKAMCKLSCSICDKNTEEQGSEGSRRRTKFRSIEQLKGHLFHQHRLFMCSLCLEGRKVFICEQKLYTRSQLNQHISTGDSEVDGSESERGGFMGHPMCEFCRNPFYGDNELYTHMSTEHYTCHICQRQHPGQYDYFRSYDDLETHFRQDHFLCEDEACLAKKFVVFQSEAEMKRHNAIEHGGHMSRSKRNAALQIPTSFRFRRSNEQEQRRGRGRGFRPDPSGNQLSMAIQASLETAMADGRARDSYSTARPVTEQRETSQSDAVTGFSESLTITSGDEPSRYAAHSQSSRSAPVIEESSFPPLSDREPPEPSSRYAQALHSGASARLGEESFPPLPGAKKSSKPKAVHRSEGLGKNTLAARLHVRNKGAVVIRSSAWSRPSDNHQTGSSSSASSQIKPATNHGISSSTSSSSQPWAAKNQGSSSSSSTVTQAKSTRENELKPISAHSSWNSNASSKMRHSSSAPNLTEVESSNHSTVVGNQVLPPARSQSPSNVEDVQTANKSLVERIRAGVGMDDDRFAAFKNISSEYRQGLINTWEYLSYVEQFGLSHLVLELARLCPDPKKQKELTDAYNANLRSKGLWENGGSNAVVSKEEGKKGKGKGKAVDRPEITSANEALTDSILESVRKLQSSFKPQGEDVESLPKDGYRAAKDKPHLSTGDTRANTSSASTNLANSTGNIQSSTSSSNVGGGGGGSSKQQQQKQRKTSKFNRIRLGDGSAAALLDLGRTNGSPERGDTESSNTAENLPVRGVWRNGGGQRLLAKSHKNSSK